MKNSPDLKITNRPFLDHIVIECFDVGLKFTNNAKILEQTSLRICQEIGVKVVNISIYQFNPIGLTVVLTLAESHLAIHTWPEKNYLTIDLLSCKKLVDKKTMISLISREINTKSILYQKIKYENQEKI